ncbi:MAG TPA: class I SAM-dependent methyltransferase [Bryobacteraceae bacterium]|nr:class I SAM-dependent methyltransferase [Bryobacteraceae bacterium]
MLSPRVKTVLDELERWGEENDRLQSDRARKMLNLERETAELLRALIAGRNAKRILEIGTSNGYSTIWLAASLAGSPENAGRVTSIDRNPEKVRMAAENLERAGLMDRVELLAGDATEIVAKLEGPFDVVFFDADRFSAPAQLALLAPKLSPNAMVLADNATSHPDEIAGYLAAIRSLPGFEHTVIPVGKGLSIAFRSV